MFFLTTYLTDAWILSASDTRQTETLSLPGQLCEMSETQPGVK